MSTDCADSVDCESVTNLVIRLIVIAYVMLNVILFMYLRTRVESDWL